MTPRITRRDLMKGIGAGLAIAAAPRVWAADAPANAPAAGDSWPRPNIVLVMTDDQGYGDLACHGNKSIKTPNIDALHARALRFTDFHVSPTCSPTRCSIMTGRHEFRSGVTHTILERERMGLEAATMPKALKDAGYTTGIFGKWHLGDQEPYQPGSRGFEEVFIHGCGGIGQTYSGSCGDAPGNKYFDPIIRHNGSFVKTTGYCTDVFFTEALRWIKKVKDRPFFAYIPTNAPHGPLVCPETYYKPYVDAGLAEGPAKFYGMITNIDENVGVLMKKLDEWKLLDNTLVIFMTDNGTASGSKIFNAGMRGNKGTPYEGGTRVPAFFYWKGRTPSGVDCPALTAHVDLFPTFAELTGAKLPEKVKLDGKSLVGLMKDPKAAWPDRYVFYHVGRWAKGKAAASKYSHCCIRSQRFALVNNTELYDIPADPGETTNVADKHPEVVAAMQKAYDQWWSEVLPAMVNEDAPVPDANPFKVLYREQEASPKGIPAWPVKPTKEEL
jgi:arylsulfatase